MVLLTIAEYVTFSHDAVKVTWNERRHLTECARKKAQKQDMKNLYFIQNIASEKLNTFRGFKWSTFNRDWY